MKHFLIIDEGGWEIEHPVDCPTTETYEGYALDYGCKLGTEASNAGIGRLDLLPHGRYEVEYWETPWRDSYGEPGISDCGVRVIVDDETMSRIDVNAHGFAGLDASHWADVARRAPKVHDEIPLSPADFGCETWDEAARQAMNGGDLP